MFCGTWYLPPAHSHGFSGPLGLKWGFWGAKWGKVVRYWPLTNSFVLLGVLASVPVLVKIDQEMWPWECSQADTQIHWHMQTDIIICPMLYAIAVGHIKRYGERNIESRFQLHLQYNGGSRTRRTCISVLSCCLHCTVDAAETCFRYYFLQNKWSVAYAALRATRHKSSKWLKSQPSVKRFRLAFIIVWTVIFKVLPVSRKLVRE